MKNLTKKSVGLNWGRRMSYRVRGFTLIELMITIAVAAVLMALAAPSFVDFQRNSALTAAANTLTASLNSARSEAMKHGAFAMVVPESGANWSQGWFVFVDKNLNQSYDAGDEVILRQPALAGYLSVSGNGTASGTAPYVLYNGSGYSRDKNGGFGALTLSVQRNDVQGAKVTAETRRVIVSRTGRVRSCRPSVDTTCTATATN